MNLEEVLESFTKDLLEELLEGNSIKYKKSASKKQLAEFIGAKAERRGTDILYAALEKDTLRSALTDLDKEPDHDSKTKMLKAFKEAWSKVGLQKTLDALSLDTLKCICSDLNFEVESTIEGDFVEQIGDEIDILGMKKYLSSMAEAFLHDCCKALNVKTSGSKKKLIDRILAPAFPHLSEEEKKKSRKQKKAEEEREVDYSIIKSGIKADELFQSFFAKELQTYCKDNGLKVSGTRREVIKRILAYLDGDETAKSGKKKRKRKAMSEATKKKKRKEKALEKKKAEEESGEKSKPAPKKTEKQTQKKRGRKSKK